MSIKSIRIACLVIGLVLIAIVARFAFRARGLAPTAPTSRDDSSLGSLVKAVMVAQEGLDRRIKKIEDTLTLMEQPGLRREAVVGTEESQPTLLDDAHIRAIVDREVERHLEDLRRGRVEIPLADWVRSTMNGMDVSGADDQYLVTLFLDEFMKDIEFNSSYGDNREVALARRNEAQTTRREYILQIYGKQVMQTIDGEWLHFLPQLKYLSTGLVQGNKN
jgi:hypothetical protein